MTAVTSVTRADCLGIAAAALREMRKRRQREATRLRLVRWASFG